MFFARSFRHKEMLQCVERTSTERSSNGESYTVYHYERTFAVKKHRMGALGKCNLPLKVDLSFNILELK